MKQFLLFFIICCLIFSCRKSTSNQPLFLQCDDLQYLDSSATSTKIVGSWTLTKQRWGSTGKVVTADKNIKVTFNSNSTYTIFDDSTVLVQGNWSLKIVLDNLWGLDFTSPSDYLSGYISFCGNQVLFSYSYLDGNDNLFEKTH